MSVGPEASSELAGVEELRAARPELVDAGECSPIDDISEAVSFDFLGWKTLFSSEVFFFGTRGTVLGEETVIAGDVLGVSVATLVSFQV